MSNTLAFGKSASKNPGRAAVFWVLFSLLFVALLIANATAVFYQRKWHQQLTPLRTEVAKLNSKVQQLEDLRTLAGEKLGQEKKEYGVIRSMLKTVRSAADMPIDPTVHVLWTSQDRWLGDEEGSYSVFFSVPTGKHRFDLQFGAFGKGNVSVENHFTDEKPFNVVLKPNSAYQFRVRHFDHTDEGCQFAMQLFDCDEVLLGEKKFRSKSKYDSLYSVNNGKSPAAVPKEILSDAGGGHADLLNLKLLCPFEEMEGVSIHLWVWSEETRVIDVLKIAAQPDSPQVRSHLGYFSISKCPRSSRHFSVSSAPRSTTWRMELDSSATDE